MSGNVWEWTDSRFEGDCSRRLIRGGSSWLYTPAIGGLDFSVSENASGHNSTLDVRLVQDR
jgi:formylglycine-generating enzyme required for sulfatase activity